MEYTRKQLLDLLKKYFKNINECSIPQDLEEDEIFPNIELYYKMFGSWEEALKEAGLLHKEENQSDQNKSHNNEQYQKYKDSGKYRQYYNKNKFKYRVNAIKQREYPDLTEEQLQLIIDNFKNEQGISICPYCGREIIGEDMMQFEHFNPI